jgi:hypothetical protein
MVAPYAFQMAEVNGGNASDHPRLSVAASSTTTGHGGERRVSGHRVVERGPSRRELLRVGGVLVRGGADQRVAHGAVGAGRRGMDSRGPEFAPRALDIHPRNSPLRLLATGRR